MPERNSRRIEVENVNHPGSIRSVDADLYTAMKRALLRVLPKSAPGITLSKLREDLLAHLPDAQFPKGAKAGWWAKTVQLDLEAKGVITRERTKPLRFHKG